VLSAQYEAVLTNMAIADFAVLNTVDKQYRPVEAKSGDVHA
jgi:hypothetical protein